MLVVGETPEALQRISAEVGGPWVQEHLAPHFAAPPDRHVGEIVAGVSVR
jgi:hypothetical protein